MGIVGSMPTFTVRAERTTEPGPADLSSGILGIAKYCVFVVEGSSVVAKLEYSQQIRTTGGA
jgi:hypothetical protein